MLTTFVAGNVENENKSKVIDVKQISDAGKYFLLVRNSFNNLLPFFVKLSCGHCLVRSAIDGRSHMRGS